MPRKLKWLLAENILEATLIILLFASPFPHLAEGRSLQEYFDILSGDAVRGHYLSLVTMAVPVSFVVRLITLEIPIRFYIRLALARRNGFTFVQLWIASFVVHLVIFTGFAWWENYIYRGHDDMPWGLAVWIFSFSVLPVLLAPWLLHRWTGKLFETVGRRDGGQDGE